MLGDESLCYNIFPQYFEKDIEYRLNQNAILFHTFYLFNKSQSTVRMGCSVLPDPNIQPVAFVTAVIEIEL